MALASACVVSATLPSPSYSRACIGMAADDRRAFVAGLPGAPASVGKRRTDVTVGLVDAAGHGREVAVAGAVLRRLLAGVMLLWAGRGAKGNGRWRGTVAGDVELRHARQTRILKPLC